MQGKRAPRVDPINAGLGGTRRLTAIREETVVSDTRTLRRSRYVATQLCLWSCCCMFFVGSVGMVVVIALRMAQT